MNADREGLLVLIASQALEEDLVDFFLDSEHQHGFTSLHVRGHSSQHDGMTLMEQVTGRTRQVQFQILVNESRVEDLCERLAAFFPGAGINYWFLASSNQGRIT